MWLNWCNLIIKFWWWRAASYEWAKKMASWDEIYHWWRCCENCWSGNKGFKILHKQFIKQEHSLRRLIPILKEVLLWIKCYLPALHATEKLFVKESVDVANFIFVLFHELVTASLAFSNHHPDQSADINIEIWPSTSQRTMTHWMLRWLLELFSKEVFF